MFDQYIRCSQCKKLYKKDYNCCPHCGNTSLKIPETKEETSIKKDIVKIIALSLVAGVLLMILGELPPI